MKMSWERSALQQNIDGQTRKMRKENRIKRKKTKDSNVFCTDFAYLKQACNVLNHINSWKGLK